MHFLLLVLGIKGLTMHEFIVQWSSLVAAPVMMGWLLYVERKCYVICDFCEKRGLCALQKGLQN